jgi:hypothetical protein
MYLPVKAYFDRHILHQKTELADVVGQCMWIGGHPYGTIGFLSGRLACPKGVLSR